MKLRLAFLAAVAMCSVGALAADAVVVPAQVDAWVRKHLQGIKHRGNVSVTYSPEFNRYAEGRVNGQDAAAVIYTVEGEGGGNGHYHKMTLFWHRGGSYIECCSRVVGSKGGKDPLEIKAVTAGFEVSGKEAGPDDPTCCPSVLYKEVFDVYNGEISKVPDAR